MREIESAALVSWPETDILENFYFDAVSPWGTFTFQFRWIDGRWRCWATTPADVTRQVGIFPGALSGTGFLDYGFDLKTNLAEIGFEDLFNTELYIVKWQS